MQLQPHRLQTPACGRIQTVACMQNAEWKMQTVACTHLAAALQSTLYGARPCSCICLRLAFPQRSPAPAAGKFGLCQAAICADVLLGLTAWRLALQLHLLVTCSPSRAVLHQELDTAHWQSCRHDCSGEALSLHDTACRTAGAKSCIAASASLCACNLPDVSTAEPRRVKQQSGTAAAVTACADSSGACSTTQAFNHAKRHLNSSSKLA